MMRDFDLAWTESGEARVSPVSCLLRSPRLWRTGTEVWLHGWLGTECFECEHSLLHYPNCLWKSRTMWTVMSAWILFCFAFCSWKNSLLPDLPGAADKERRSCLYFPAGFRVQCLRGQVLTSGSWSDLIPSFPLSFPPLLSLPPLLIFLFLFLTFPSSPPPLFPPTHPSIPSFILDTESHCVDQIGFKLSLFARDTWALSLQVWDTTPGFVPVFHFLSYLCMSVHPSPHVEGGGYLVGVGSLYHVCSVFYLDFFFF